MRRSRKLILNTFRLFSNKYPAECYADIYAVILLFISYDNINTARYIYNIYDECEINNIIHARIWNWRMSSINVDTRKLLFQRCSKYKYFSLTNVK